MKRTMFATMAALLLGSVALAQEETMDSLTKIGNMPVATFNTLNEKGNKMVAAIQPTKTPLSAADKKLFLQVAAGGQRQLAMSQAVLDKATNPQVKLLAQSQVEEQTGVAAKLKEIATAKGISLPEGPDAAAQALVTKAQNLEEGEVDAFYINESGVKGHELLQKTMVTVNGTAKDPALKKLAAATLPVIRTHLAVSKEVKRMMGVNDSAAR